MAQKHTIGDLRQMQALPLSAKIRMTERRILDWVDAYGENGVYVSFSGGKDSTVLLDIVRNRLGLTEVPAVFVDVPTQYPELKEFAQSFDNVIILKPKMSFMQVCEKYGFPLISKEIAECIYYSKQYLESINSEEGAKKLKGHWAIADICGIPRRMEAKNSEIYNEIKSGKLRDDSIKNGLPVRLLMLMGEMEHTEHGEKTGEFSRMYDRSKWRFMLDSPFQVSRQCCYIMKKQPIKKYQVETGRNPMTGQMASESMVRQSQWTRYGCNMYEAKYPISNPMAFWTDQDVLQYIKEYNIPICSVYGDIVEDTDAKDVDGQLTIQDMIGGDLFGTRKKLKTTGCNRTGCMLCGFGAHCEKNPNRFQQLKETHPGMYNLLDVVKNNGVTMREAIEWMNEHGERVNIKL